MLLKILKTKTTIIEPKPEDLKKAVYTVGTKIQNKITKLFNGSLAIRVVTAGSTNACEAELVALGNSFYDIDRFGVHFVASPRHADMVMVTGPVSRNMRQGLVRTVEATPDPKIVVTIGDDAINGGIFKGSYAVLDGAHNVTPVHFSIPGDPPSPYIIMCSLLEILNSI
jgi:Ni,Fe-hydrogenase III small subunit